MSKYDRLGSYLREQGMEQVPMTFAEIERVVGTKLPKSQKHPAWWSNSTSNNVMTQVWLDAGYRTEHVDTAARKLIFRRIKPVYGGPSMSPHASGMAVSPPAFKHDDLVIPSTVSKSPIFGALKGTFTIEPGYDLAQSPFTQEELDYMDKRMEEKAALIEAGMRKPK